MKKRNISIGVAIAIVALLFAGTGIALAATVNDVYFYQESMVEGTGLVMVDKDISTIPWLPGDPAHNLETNLHIHGCGDYEVDQVLKLVVVSNYTSGIVFLSNDTSGRYIVLNGINRRPVSQSIEYCEDAEMTFKPITLTSGSMTLIDDDTSVKWKEDLCIKNYQIGTAMRAKYTDADYIKKTIESNVTCVESYALDKDNNEDNTWWDNRHPEDRRFWDYKETPVDGYGLAKMDILSTVSGASHIGVVVKDRYDPRITRIRVSEDYIGNFTIEKNMKVKMLKKAIAPKDLEDWLPCPFEADLGHNTEFYEGDC